MNQKINFTIGVDAEGKLQPIYLGTDGQEAKDAYTRAINGEVEGIETVYLFIRPSHDRRHNVVKSSPVRPEAVVVEKAVAPEGDSAPAAEPNSPENTPVTDAPAVNPAAPAKAPVKEKKRK